MNRGEMDRVGAKFAGVAAFALVGVAVSLHAQGWKEVPPTELKVRQVSSGTVHPMLFATDGGDSRQGEPVTFRSADQMTPHERDLVADAESSIGERAGFDGIEFNEGKWSYQELGCRALPHHMFLKFTRSNGARDVSMFTASIPRDGNGRVRIIPIMRRGYSLFSPAPIGALTISAFNHIRKEEQESEPANWLDIASCYAALAESSPRFEVVAEGPDSQTLPLASGPVMEIPSRGGAIIRASDQAAPRPLQWTMIFDAKGRLLKVQRKPASLLTVKTVPPDPEVK